VIRAMAEKAHAAGTGFVYSRRSMCITANAANQPHSFFKDHPTGCSATGRRTAMFGGGLGVWIKKGDEDVWISPYAPRVAKALHGTDRQNRRDGIDGIWW